MLDQLFAEAVTDCAGDRAAWLEEAMAEPPEVERFHRAFSAVARVMGRGPLRCGPERAATIEAAGGPSRIARWSVDHAARAALLLRMLGHLPAAAHLELVNELFYRGETREKQAVLRTLPCIPDPARFVPLAIDACRTSSREEFEAIAIDNTFPAGCFPDPAFNQMVLKAIFVGVSVTAIVGLELRASPELARMVESYASERRAASRAIPEDIEHVLRLAGC